MWNIPISLIQCSACRETHARPGGIYCKNANSSKAGVQDGGASNPRSPNFTWEGIVAEAEIETIPERSDPTYLPFCEKIIQELSQQLKDSEEEQKVCKAEDEIAELLSQLRITSPRSKVPAHTGPATNGGSQLGDFISSTNGFIE